MSAGSVAVAVVDNTPMYEVAIACEVFGVEPTDLADPWYDLRLCAELPGATWIESGFVLDTRHSLADLTGADTVIVPAVPHVCLQPGREIPPKLVPAARHSTSTSRCRTPTAMPWVRCFTGPARTSTSR